MVYLTARGGSCGGGDLGQATGCSWEPSTGRTLAGAVNICPAAIDGVLRAAAAAAAAAPAAPAAGWDVSSVATLPEFGSLVDTIAHEALHLLGFSTELYPKFRTREGRPGPAATLEGPDGQLLLATPKVLEVAREHYGCDAIEGVPMEDAGGDGTRGSHWEVSYVGDRDVMLGTSFRPGRAVLSSLTLALLEDSGWYDVNWDTAGAWGFGAGLGCAVMDPVERCKDRRYFCDPGAAASGGEAAQCSWDSVDVGRCFTTEAFPPGCGLVQPFSNYLCRAEEPPPPGGGGGAGGQGLWGEARGPNSRCVEVAPEPEVWRVRPGRFQTVSAPRGGGAACYRMECRGGAQEPVLQLLMKGRAVPCPKGELVDLSTVRGLGFSSGTVGPCPDPAEVCPGLQREDDCNGLGDSVGGKCSCYLGFSGEDCLEMVAFNDTVQGYSGRSLSGAAPGGAYPTFEAPVTGAPDWLPRAILAALIFAASLSLSSAACAIGSRCCAARGGRRRVPRRAPPRREVARAPPPEFAAA